MKIFICFFIIVIFSNCRNRNTPVDKSTILGIDYRLFQGTEVWDLAKAVDDGDISAIKKQIISNKVNVNSQEPLYGKTLLMLSVLNGQYNSCRALLECGADPNIHDTYSGSSAIIDAANVDGVLTNGTKLLKLLLSHGANPNDEEVGRRREGNSTRLTPLLVACGNSDKLSNTLERVKLLVAAGAIVNYRNEFGITPLSVTLPQENLDIAFYLLQNGADYTKPISHIEGKDYYLSDELRFILVDVDSKKFEEKQKIITFLKEHEVNYRATKIPDYAIDYAKKQYPKNWKIYLEKY